MPFYRKKPVVIEARQYPAGVVTDLVPFLGELADLVDWLGDAFGGVDEGELLITTLEDGSNGQARHVASPGDYIIKGIQGEFYPCKPDIFAKTYDSVE